MQALRLGTGRELIDLKINIQGKNSISSFRKNNFITYFFKTTGEKKNHLDKDKLFFSSQFSIFMLKHKTKKRLLQ